ncbi:molybdopterin-guanine dinucleotide biosynthesis protein B [Alkalibaculum sp. M08DMB]|uniref:Molybdopterin-guanine dinucleotide biosynthesis protein B n=1 Tax=Alkalibaculum sporogenes TaxID=2655001 RepID=A0A6A7K683_9FIRM|nr:molybdopterin-guanine dinucleotide biosynthesis protein B [Alkalibaculum sporogenes]MPW24727.1 molybdopterin-guanine dinucleotide biosynthesis protein B [Alkalibaculum sporogenes]
MVPVISIVGRSNSGKTTLIENIIPIFKERNLRVGTIKHDAHRFDIDHEGKDTWRMAQSGADKVLISSKDKIAMIEKPIEEKSIHELIQEHFQHVDIVITEGYKQSNIPKIEVIRFNLPIIPKSNNLIGIVDNRIEENNPIKTDVEVFDFNNYIQIANFIVKYLFSTK